MYLKLLLISLLVPIVFTFTESDYYLKGISDHPRNMNFNLAPTSSDKVFLKYDNESGMEDFVSETHNVTDPSPEIRHTSGFKHQSKLSPFGDLVFGSLLVIFCLLSLVGNGLIVIMFYFRQRRLSPVEVFLVNLAIVDILLAVASYPMSTTSSFKHHWDFGELGCTFYAFTCYFLGVASIYSVTSIAIIRYVKTCTHARGNRVTCWTALKLVLWGYLISIVWAALPLLGIGNYGFEPYGTSCTLEWISTNEASTVYIILVSVFCVLLPLSIIIFCYTKILLLVNKSNSIMQNSGVKQNKRRSDMQLTLISGLVTVGFVVGWFPYSIVSLWASFRGETILPIWATPIPVLLAKSSIAYNPIIYIFLTARYREDLKELTTNWTFSGESGHKPRRQCSRKKVTSERSKSPAKNNSDEISVGANNTDTVQVSTLGSKSSPTLGEGIELEIIREDRIKDDSLEGEERIPVKRVDLSGSVMMFGKDERDTDAPKVMVLLLENGGSIKNTLVSKHDTEKKRPGLASEL